MCLLKRQSVFLQTHKHTSASSEPGSFMCVVEVVDLRECVWLHTRGEKCTLGNVLVGFLCYSGNVMEPAGDLSFQAQEACQFLPDKK